jgi:hypothetical protein
MGTAYGLSLADLQVSAHLHAHVCDSCHLQGPSASCSDDPAGSVGGVWARPRKHVESAGGRHMGAGGGGNVGWWPLPHVGDAPYGRGDAPEAYRRKVWHAQSQSIMPIVRAEL